MTESEQSRSATAQAVADRVAEFVRSTEESGWIAALASVAEQAADWPAKRRQALFVALAREFKTRFVGSGADTELERIQVARHLSAQLAATGLLKRGALRTSIELAQRSRDHERVLTLGEEMLSRFREQAVYTHQAMGSALFALKRLDEARDHLGLVPEAERSGGTLRLIARLDAGDQIQSARTRFEEGIALGEAHKLRPADAALNEAIAELHPGLGTGKHALPQMVAALRGKAPKPSAAPDDAPTALFCGGFRWSGASAIYDLLAEQPDVAMFPRRPRFMQDSAGSLQELVAAFDGPKDALLAAVRDFVCRQIVGIAAATATPAAALRTLENSLLTQIEPGVDLRAFDAQLATFVAAVLAEASKPAEDRAFPAAPFAATLGALSVAITPAGTRFVLFDSVIRAAGAALIRRVPGARLVTVFRDPRDMYVTHVERGNWSRGVERYAGELRALFNAYEEAVADPEVAEACRAVHFESLVEDAAVREELLAWAGLGDGANPNPGGRFVAEQSAANVGVYRAFADQSAVQALHAAFPDRCLPDAAADAAAAPAPADRSGDTLDVLSLSAMATRRQQLDRMSVAGRDGEPGWKRRREIVVNLIVDGGYDFVGLQHCATSTAEPRFDAATYFREKLAERGLSYGMVNRAAGEDPDNGDSTPLYYRTDRWDLDEDDWGFEWFATPPPGADAPGGGGLLFLYGLFHERGADRARSGRSVYVYNVRLRNRHTEELDRYRAMCFLEIDRHMARRRERSAPVVLLGDTNTKAPDSLADRLLRGLEVEMDGEVHHPLTGLRDTVLLVDPALHGKVRSQHDFVRPGRLEGKDRNDRVLASPDLGVVAAEIMSYNEDGSYPSYHYPVNARLQFT